MTHLSEECLMVDTDSWITSPGVSSILNRTSLASCHVGCETDHDAQEGSSTVIENEAKSSINEQL
jgi:hypothetical protein